MDLDQIKTIVDDHEEIKDIMLQYRVGMSYNKPFYIVFEHRRSLYVQEFNADGVPVGKIQRKVKTPSAVNYLMLFDDFD